MKSMTNSPAWTSFEAEAFRVSVWRCDATPPSELASRYFPGWGHYPPERSTATYKPNLQMYGTRTVFASGNPHGVDAYLSHDSNVFNNGRGVHGDVREKMMIAFGRYAKMPETGATSEPEDEETPRAHVPFKYRITADSHHVIPLRGGLERYGNRFRLFADARSRCFKVELRLQDHLAFDEEMLTMAVWEPLERGMDGDKFDIRQLTDEVHVHGPIPRAGVGSRVAAGRVELVSAEWLDLAV